MPVNIHLIRTHYPHWGAFSGIHQFARFIDRDRYKMVMRLVSDSDEDFPVRNETVRSALRYAVQRRGMGWYKLSDLVAEFDAFRQSRRSEADIVHYLDGEHSAQFLPGVLKMFRRDGPKLVGTYHQPPDLLESLTIKDVISRLDCVTVQCPEQAAYFKEFLPADKVRLILHGIDIDFFRPGDGPREKGKFRCITVGHHLRDFNVLREVAENLSCLAEIEFHVVSSRATELAGLGNVTIHSGIDDTALLELYQGADALFLPLVQSTANNSLLEAIACGLPVVSTDLPSVKAYLPGKEAVLIKDNDPEHFTEAILHLVRNRDDRIVMGKEARKRAEELDWRKIAPEYETIYSGLADS